MEDEDIVTIVHPKAGESQILWESLEVWERHGWSLKKDSASKPATETTSKENVEQSKQTSVAPAPLSISATQED